MSLLVRLAAGPAGSPVAEGEQETARMLHEAARLQLQLAELMRREFDLLRAEPRSTPPRSTSPSHRGPLNPQHRTWRGFVEDLQNLETRAVREDLKLTKANVARFGFENVRTITRTMQWYGLNATDWPPSNWDATEDRHGGNG